MTDTRLNVNATLAPKKPSISKKFNEIVCAMLASAAASVIVIEGVRDSTSLLQSPAYIASATASVALVLSFLTVSGSRKKQVAAALITAGVMSFAQYSTNQNMIDYKMEFDARPLLSPETIVVPAQTAVDRDCAHAKPGAIVGSRYLGQDYRLQCP